MSKVARKCLFCGKDFEISAKEIDRGRGRYCRVACVNRGRAREKALAVKQPNQVKESFTLPLRPYNITISKLLNGNVLVFSDIPTDQATPCVAAAVKTVENTVLAHHMAGVNVLDPSYLKGLSAILHTVCRTHAAEIWGYNTDD